MQSNRRLDWEDVKTLAEIANSRTVRNAARALNIHHSTVSRRIERLEDAFGARLFDRLPEGLALTKAGEELVQAASTFSRQLDDVDRRITGQDSDLSGRISVTMPDPIATLAFAPRLPEFVAQYPAIEIEIIASFDILDVARREADVAIRLDNNPPQSLFGKRLFPYYSTVYASPDYLERLDLARHPERARWLGWSEDDDGFPAWTQETEFARAPVWGSFFGITLQTAAAVAGLGLTWLPCFCGDREPGLVRATSRPPTPSRDIWILTHGDLRRTARVRKFMDFAEAVMRANEGAIKGLV